MDKAEFFTKRQQSKKYKTDDFILPFEWLHPKSGRHIESIDCLLHHDDLIKGTDTSSSKSDKRKPIEGCLFEKNITQWEGTITSVRSDWQGTITFKGRLPVRFVPLSAQPSMPSTGETVKFCLSFDGFGLSAWRVMRDVAAQPSSFSDIVKRGDDSSSEYSEPEDENEDLRVAPSLCSVDIQEPDEEDGFIGQKDQVSKGAKRRRAKRHWEDLNGQRMKGVVTFTDPEKGYGFIENADIEDRLFFHPSQLRVPVKDLEGTVVKDMLLEFMVEKLKHRTRAADIRVLEGEENHRIEILEKVRKRKTHSSSPKMHSNDGDRRQQQGSVLRFDDAKGFGFIQADQDKRGKEIYFHRRNLRTKGRPPKARDRVEFRMGTDNDGRTQAMDILVQNKPITSNTWNNYCGAGIQEGFVRSTNDDGGFINSSKVTGAKSNLPFRSKDIQSRSKDAVVEGTKVHFEVLRRGGKCWAVKIYVVDTPEDISYEMRQAEGGAEDVASNDF